MKLELNLVDGICCGFNLVAEDEAELRMLDLVRDMCFVNNKRDEKIAFTGVTRDDQTNITQVIFMQRYISNMPETHRTKREFQKALLQRTVQIQTI